MSGGFIGLAACTQPNMIDDKRGTVCVEGAGRKVLLACGVAAGVEVHT